MNRESKANPDDSAGELPDADASSRQEEREVWSIGIYTGDSPLRLSSPSGVVNPVLTKNDVTDVEASFVADPFMLVEDGAYYMFFEVMNSESDTGEIGLAISNDGFRWEYRQIVIKEDFHLSYPYVFKWEGEYYMTPETLGAEAILLYKAIHFPLIWSRSSSLVVGTYADPSIFRFANLWWIFACPRPSYHDALRLYYCDQLAGRWREHPQSPIVEGNPRTARPAGRVTAWGGNLIRFAQDCVPRYGSRVRAFQINEMTAEKYDDEEAAESPVLCAGSEGWNSSGMHTIDPHLTAHGKWIACVDGCRDEIE